MPITTSRFGKDRKNSDDSMNMYNAASDDIKIKDFSDDIDVEGLGSLLSGNVPSAGRPQPPEPKKNNSFAENIGNFIKNLADKLGTKDQPRDIPDLPDSDDHSDDPNYVSETVSFVDYENLPQAEQFNDNNVQSDSQAYTSENVDNQRVYDDFRLSPDTSCDSYRDENMYMPQQSAEIPASQENYVNNYPNDYQAYSNQPQSQYQPYSNATQEDTLRYHPNDNYYAGRIDEYQSYSSYSSDTNAGYRSFEQDSYTSGRQEVDSNDAYESEEEPVRRPHDIMGAFRARIEQFRRRLPSFKPKEYVVPEPSYDETQDDFIKGPSLVADIEKIIRKQSDLGEVSREYEEMRQYIRSVDENKRLQRHEITPPENIHEIYSAESELFDMIHRIGAENEQQRSRIGIYEQPEAQDPYNYRGINADKQINPEIEFASFSMSSSIDFESENKVSVERMMWERKQNQVQTMQDISSGNEFEPNFENDFFDEQEDRTNHQYAAVFDDSVDLSQGQQFVDDGFDDDLSFDDDFSDNGESKNFFGLKAKVKPQKR